MRVAFSFTNHKKDEQRESVRLFYYLCEMRMDGEDFYISRFLTENPG